MGIGHKMRREERFEFRNLHRAGRLREHSRHCTDGLRKILQCRWRSIVVWAVIRHPPKAYQVIAANPLHAVSSNLIWPPEPVSCNQLSPPVAGGRIQSICGESNLYFRNPIVRLRKISRTVPCTLLDRTGYTLVSSDRMILPSHDSALPALLRPTAQTQGCGFRTG